MNESEWWIRDFPIGSKIHIGYCEATVIGVSPLKGYGPRIKLTPSHKDPIGAKKMAGRILDCSPIVVREFKLLEKIKEIENETNQTNS